MSLAGLLRAFAVISLVAGGGVAASADEDTRASGERALIMPLADVLARVAETYEGRVLKVELEDEDDEYGVSGPRPVYEIKLLTPRGDVLKLYVDARTGAVLEVKGRRRDRDRDRDRD